MALLTIKTTDDKDEKYHNKSLPIFSLLYSRHISTNLKVPKLNASIYQSHRMAKSLYHVQRLNALQYVYSVDSNGNVILMHCFSIPASNVALGDVLIIVGASLYGVSNTCEEYVVRHFDKIEFLGMVGFFGSFINGAQL